MTTKNAENEQHTMEENGESSAVGDSSATVHSENANTGPSSPAPSVSCETCSTQFSALEKDAFAAVREMAPYVTTIAISELLSRTSELIFLNIVTLENESFCVELTQRGWRVCSDRLDCMNGDFHKLDMHVVYYESINQLLDSLSQQYRDRFSAALASKLSVLQTEQQQQQQQRQQQQNGEEKHALE
uniref:GSKIP domain-containing protein n=1 Tax=Globodera rostochiensis TaxID=31243 RepID=A0A914HA92_GLORO